VTKLPQVKSKEIITVLLKKDFVLHRQVGSHATFKRMDGCRVTVPIHSGRTIPKGTLLNILRQAGITKQELKELLKK